jgi:hypothetical protein
MSKPTSVLAGLWGFVKNLALAAVLAWIGWYAYSQLDPATAGVTDSKQGVTFNCGRAVAERESDYACIDSNSCTLTPDELTAMKHREADIDRYCGLGFNPLPDIVLN